MTKTDLALKLFNGNFNCSQAVFSAFAEQLGIEKEMALKIACGFGAGMAQQQLHCGAVTGAMMVIGLKYGNCSDEDIVSKPKTYKLIHEFNKKFLEKFPSLKCRDLVNCDFTTEEGEIYFKENDIQEKVCSNCIRHAIEILEEMLKEN